MSKAQIRIVILIILAGALIVVGIVTRAALDTTTPIEKPGKVGHGTTDSFALHVRPFVEKYCQSCHGPEKREGGLDLSLAKETDDVAMDWRNWGLALERLTAEEMPPAEAARQPTKEERAAIVKWLSELRSREVERSAGDPGVVLARRLSNAEYDYTIRDLTGVDIRPARQFPIDPANQAGFDNSGESLTMSPALLKKYLAAARLVADHVVLKPDGFVFAPHPVVTDTDRDKYCVQRVVDFYKKHAVDVVDYLYAARKVREMKDVDQVARTHGLSVKYLEVVWRALSARELANGPMALVRRAWLALPQDPEKAIVGCEKIRTLIADLRDVVKPDVKKLTVTGISQGSQPLVLWRNRQIAGLHRTYTGDIIKDSKKIVDTIDEPEIEKLFPFDDEAAKPKLKASFEQFASAFPDAFAVIERGPFYDPGSNPKGRFLSAGFHLMHGYFRDDKLFCDWFLNDRERAELDQLWWELDFITQSPLRQYKDFIFFERAEPPRYMIDAEFDFARSEDKDVASEAKMTRLAELYLAKAEKKKASPEAIDAIKTYFAGISKEIHRVESARGEAAPKQLKSLVNLAERAFRRPLSPVEHDEILAFYSNQRDVEGLSHEDALRDSVVSILMSPRFCYRLELSKPGDTAQSLDDFELANRLSYFLWSSMPDVELFARATKGDLRQPEIMRVQIRRMLRDPKARGLATEFAGNWLDFRQFEDHNAVDRERFPTFTNELRQAMYEEPIRYFLEIVQRDRSVLDLLDGKDTIVNRPLAKHYGMPQPAINKWEQIDNADRFGRGGLLPMAIFQTKNSPGLRTSPVKRGYWVVTRILGERIPPPPPSVPELPKDEAHGGDLTLPQLLERHRADKACAGCHAKFDSFGLVFEGFGPIGERRKMDLGGKPVSSKAEFPDGVERSAIDGLRDYIRTKRRDDFVDNLCRKLLAFALGRTLIPSDDKLVMEMRTKLAADGYRFESLVESIVMSRQFQMKK
jgi:hypothetical protein